MELEWWCEEDNKTTRTLWPWFIREPNIGAGHSIGVKPPRSGDLLWTSPVDSLHSWHYFCITECYEEGVRGHQHWQITLNDSARLLVIDHVMQLEGIVKEYPCKGCGECLDAAYSNLKGWPPFPVDWPALAADYVGIHLTAEGEYSTRLPSFGRGGDYNYSLYGWDCETVLLWDRDLISNPRRLL